jgi:hypothetical protein
MKAIVNALSRPGAWLVPAMLMVAVAAHGADPVHYSIHLGTYAETAAAGRVTARTDIGAPMFWKHQNVGGKVEIFHLYVGKYRSQREAIAAWEILRREGMVRDFAIHLFRPPPTSTAVEPDGPSARKAVAVPTPPKALPPVSASANRFVDNGDGTVTDRRLGLMWMKNAWMPEFVSAVTWWKALEKLQKLQWGGYEGWRLPTLQEWKTVLDSRQQYPSIVEPNPFENIITHMPYWSQTEYTYGEDYTCNNICPFEAYTVMLYAGTVFHQNKSKRAFVLPVRSLN